MAPPNNQDLTIIKTAPIIPADGGCKGGNGENLKGAECAEKVEKGVAEKTRCDEAVH